MGDQTNTSAGHPGFLAAATLLGGLARLAGVIAGLSAVAYYIGWREERAYYENLGCQWFLQLVPTTSLVQVAIPAIFSTAIFAFLAFESLVQGRATSRGLSRWFNWLALIGLIAPLLPLERVLGAKLMGLISVAAAALLSAAAGVLIGLLVARLAESQQQWKAEHLNLLYLLVFLGLWTIPENHGSERATQDGDPVTSRLSVASVRDDPGDEWRLVAALEKQLLLVQLTPRSQDRRFRLVDSADVLGIRAPPPKPAAAAPPQRR